MVIRFIIFIAVITFHFRNVQIGVNYFSSMLFLGFISSNPVNRLRFKTGEILIYREATIIESFSGKGLYTLFSKLISYRNSIVGGFAFAPLIGGRFFLILIIFFFF